jgi:hypothetical protein
MNENFQEKQGSFLEKVQIEKFIALVRVFVARV